MNAHFTTLSRQFVIRESSQFNTSEAWPSVKSGSSGHDIVQRFAPERRETLNHPSST